MWKWIGIDITLSFNAIGTLYIATVKAIISLWFQYRHRQFTFFSLFIF